MRTSAYIDRWLAAPKGAIVAGVRGGKPITKGGPNRSAPCPGAAAASNGRAAGDRRLALAPRAWPVRSAPGAFAGKVRASPFPVNPAGEHLGRGHDPHCGRRLAKAVADARRMGSILTLFDPTSMRIGVRAHPLPLAFAGQSPLSALQQTTVLRWDGARRFSRRCDG